mmetsp:Transcript_9423/g.28670  ORF Transcript_9423/g.28670 Transcript_9423/m.28670 type:complete len:108 (+) Transcript_9423:211-534(+)
MPKFSSLEWASSSVAKMESSGSKSNGALCKGGLDVASAGCAKAAALAREFEDGDCRLAASELTHRARLRGGDSERLRNLLADVSRTCVGRAGLDQVDGGRVLRCAVR